MLFYYRLGDDVKGGEDLKCRVKNVFVLWILNYYFIFSCGTEKLRYNVIITYSSEFLYGNTLSVYNVWFPRVRQFHVHLNFYKHNSSFVNTKIIWCGIIDETIDWITTIRSWGWSSDVFRRGKLRGNSVEIERQLKE